MTSVSLKLELEQELKVHGAAPFTAVLISGNHQFKRNNEQDLDLVIIQV